MQIPKGHYSPAVIYGGLVYVSGQLPIHNDGTIETGDIEEQVKVCMKKIETILMEADSSRKMILKVNIFLSDISLWSRVNAVYSEIMGDHKPARVIVPCPELHYGCSVEIDCIAALNI